MKITLDVDLDKFRYSLVGDGYLLTEVKKMSNEDLITILTKRINRHIETGYEKSIRYDLLG